MSWHKVKVVAKEGTQFGIIYDENGELALIVKNQDEDWPYKLKPTGGENQISEGCRAYVVVTDDFAEHFRS